MISGRFKIVSSTFPINSNTLLCKAMIITNKILIKVTQTLFGSEYWNILSEPVPFVKLFI